MLRRVVLAWTVGLILTGQALGARPNDKPAIPPELPPFPCSPQQANRYFDEATAFLGDHRDSPHAPSVLYNLVMLAQIGKQDDKVLDLRHRLVLQYPRSIPAAHLAGTLERPADYRTILRVQLDRSASALTSKTYALAFYQALELGMGRWGAKFLDDEKFMIEAAVAAHVTEQKTASQFLTYVRIQGKPDTRKVVDIFVDPVRSDADKLDALYQLDEDAPTAVCLEILWDRLPEAERATLGPLRARVDYLCRKGQLTPVLSSLKESQLDDPQLSFWRIWAAIGRSEKSVIEGYLAAMTKLHPDSPWTQRAAELLARAGDIEKNLQDQTDVWIAAAGRLRDPNTGIEADVLMGADDKGFRYRGYVAVAPRERLFELHLRDAKETIVAYEASAKRARLVAADDLQVMEFPASDVFPAVRWTAADDARSFARDKVGFRFNMVSAEAFESSAPRALDLPQLRSATRLSATLGDAFLSGYLPCPVVKQGDRTTVEWIRPNPRTGEITAWEFTFDGDDRLRRVRGPSLQVDALRYVGDKDWRANRPAWPDLPVKRFESFDATAFTKIMGVMAKVMETLSPKDDKQAVAGEKPAAR